MQGPTVAEEKCVDEKYPIAEKTDNVDPVLDEARQRTERSLVRKLDMTLMPVVWVLYFFNYMDRNNIA